MAELPERDSALLLDMLLAAQDAQAFVKGLDEAAFLASRLHQNACIRSLEVIGEAAGKVSAITQTAHPEFRGAKSRECAIVSSTAMATCVSTLFGSCFAIACLLCSQYWSNLSRAKSKRTSGPRAKLQKQTSWRRDAIEAPYPPCAPTGSTGCGCAAPDRPAPPSVCR
jgi:hypothetical protein